MSVVQFCKEEFKALISFLRKPVYRTQERSFLQKLKFFGFIILLNILVLGIVAFVFSAVEFFGFGDIFESNKIGDIFEDKSLGMLVLLIVFIGPLTEELIFRLHLHLKYRGWVMSIFLISFVFFLISTIIQTENNVFKIIIGSITLIVLALFFAYIKKITRSVAYFWKQKFHIVFYSTALAFALIHIFNYDLSLKLLLWTPLLVLPQLTLGFLIGYIRVKSGFFWGVALHSFSNGIVILPYIFIQTLIER